MRLIDANALLEYCNNQKYKMVDMNDIARFPTAVGWVSVNDRLPDKSGNVLVCYGEYNCVMVLNYSCRHHAFNAFDSLPDTELKIDDVNYWMPIPEPPKEAMQND